MRFPLLMTLVWTLIGQAGRSAHGAEIALALYDLGADPQNINVNVGDTVRWLRKYDADPNPYQVEAYSGEFASPILTGAGPSFVHQFTEPGTFAYRVLKYNRPPNVQAITPGTIHVVPWTNEPPRITINHPVGGFVFSEGGNFPILVSVTLAPDQMDRVEIMAGTNLLGVVKNAPFRLGVVTGVEGLRAGKYDLTANAIDKMGEQAISRSVNITVDVFGSRRLSHPRLLPGGQFLFDYTFRDGRRYALQWSKDLIEWEGGRGTLVGPFGTYVEELGTNAGPKFYRVVPSP